MQILSVLSGKGLWRTFVLCTALSASACTGAQLKPNPQPASRDQAEAKPAAQAAAESTPASTPKAGGEEQETEGNRSYPALTGDVLYKVLLAEMAGQRGDVDLAIKTYMDLARTIPDPELAERAARVALFGHREDLALEAARIWVADDPKSLDAHQVLATMLLRNDKTQDAIDEFKYVLSQGNGTAGQKLRVIAAVLAREKDKDRSLYVMRKLVADHRDDPQALFALGLIAIHAGKYDVAKRNLEDALKSDPDNINMVLAYLGVLQKQGDTAAAVQWLQDQVQKHPKSFNLRMVYARVLADMQRYDEARKQFETLHKAKPEDADVQYALGLLYLQTSNFDKAAHYFHALEKEGTHADAANYYLGQIAEFQGHPKEALDHYRKIGRSEHYFDAQLRIALLLSKQGKANEAQEQLHALTPESTQQQLEIARTEGEILTNEGDYKAALKVYNKALKGRYDTALLYSRAMLGEKMDRLDILERDLREILKHEPDNAQALNALGYTLADRTDRTQEAYKLIKKALKIRPNDYYILDSMGWVLYRMGRLDESVKYLEKARAIKDDPEVAAHLAEVLWAKGEKARAKQVWERALKDSPGDKTLLKVIERLQK